MTEMSLVSCQLQDKMFKGQKLGYDKEPELKVSEPTISEYQIQYETESKIQEMQVLGAPKFGTHKPQTSSESEPKVSESQVLKSPEPESSSVQTLEKSEAMTSESEALMKPDQRKMKAKVQGCSRCKQ